MYAVDRSFKSDNWFAQVIGVYRAGLATAVRAVFWEGHKGVYVRAELMSVLGNALPAFAEGWPVRQDWTELECIVPFSVNDLNGAPGSGLVLSANVGVGINLMTLSADDRARPGRHLFKDERFANFSIGVGMIGGPVVGQWLYQGAAGPQGQS